MQPWPVVFLCVAIGFESLASGAGSPVPGAGDRPFLDYLSKPQPRAALVCYSPTNHDPRPGPHRRVPPRESLRKDLEALRTAFDGLILYGFDKDVTPVLLAEAARLKYRAVLLGIWDPRLAAERAGT